MTKSLNCRVFTRTKDLDNFRKREDVEIVEEKTSWGIYNELLVIVRFKDLEEETL